MAKALAQGHGKHRVVHTASHDHAGQHEHQAGGKHLAGGKHRA